MKSTRYMLVLAALFPLLLLNTSAGQATTEEPGLSQAMAENLFSPELLRLTHENLGLTAAQEETLAGAAAEIEARITSMRRELTEASHALLEATRPDKIDEARAMVLAEQVTRLQAEMQRARFALLIKLKNTLTPEQQAKLKTFKTKTPLLQEKVRKVKELADKRKGEGRDISAVEKSKAEFDRLLSQEKFKEADDLLDQTIRFLQKKP